MAMPSSFTRLFILLTVLHCLAFTGLMAQDSTRYSFRHISTTEGLSSTYVRCIVQDPYGFLWIGTQDGLNRYDGKRFTIYNKGIKGSHEIEGNDIRALQLDTARHMVWVVSSYGGLDGIDYQTGQVVYHYAQSGDARMDTVLFVSMALSGKRLFVGSFNSGLYILDDSSKDLKQVKLPVSAQSIGAIKKDDHGQIWLFCNGNTVLTLDEQTLKVIHRLRAPGKLDSHDAGFQFHDIEALANQRFLAATSMGLRSYYLDQSGELTCDPNPLPQAPFTKGEDVYACRLDQQGAIWYAIHNHLVRLDPGTRKPTLIRENYFKDPFQWVGSVFSIFFDRENNCWLGCEQGLAFTPNKASPFLRITESSSSDVKIRDAYYLAPDPQDDSILYCCAQEDLYKINLAKGIIQPIGNRQKYLQIFRDPMERLVASEARGNFILSGKNQIPIEDVYPEFGRFRGIYFTSHAGEGDSVMVFGTDANGIILWNYREHRTRVIDEHTTPLCLNGKFVENVYTDSRGMLWVLGEHSVTIFDLKNNKSCVLDIHDPKNKKSYSIFFDVCEAGGEYYLATYGSGVLVIDSSFTIREQITTDSGLSNNNTYKVIPFRDSLVLVTSNLGLSVIRIKAPRKISCYYYDDGLHSDHFQQNTSCKVGDIVYAGGGDGLTAIRPNLLESEPAAPVVYLDGIKMQTTDGKKDTSDVLLTSLEIPSNIVSTDVSFTAIQYGDPEHITFEYKINELDKNWIQPVDGRTINLIGLKPGKYTLTVRAISDLGVESKEYCVLHLNYLPKWYQTWWFRLTVAVASILLLYSIYRYRIGQIEKQQQIRRSIASDLHDDIGSILHTVKLFTHMAKREPEKKEHLDRIEDSITMATLGLRDMLWVLDDNRDTLGDLMERIRSFVQPQTEAQGIELKCHLNEAQAGQLLGKSQKRNLLLIAKETVHNSLKYSSCSILEVMLSMQDKRIAMSISDDGKGFKPGEGTGGYGLTNIQQRAEQINFRAAIDSAPGEGTRVTVAQR